MAVDTANIIIGAGILKIDGEEVGATRDGVVMGRTVEFYDVTCDQANGVIKKHLVNQTRVLRTSLLEATLENLKLAWGGIIEEDDVEGTKTLKMGVKDGSEEHTLTFIGPAPGEYKTRTYTVHRAINVSASEHSYLKNGEVVIPVEFEILPDMTQPEGEEWGTIVDSMN